MSDAAITSIVSGAVTVFMSLIGFFTLWAKLRYGVQKVEEASHKVDENTVLTKKIDGQTNGGMDVKFADHAARITTLESEVSSLRVELSSIGKNLDSTRHEMRGHLQSITNSLQILATVRVPPAVAPVVKEES